MNGIQAGSFWGAARDATLQCRNEHNANNDDNANDHNDANDADNDVDVAAVVGGCLLSLTATNC